MALFDIPQLLEIINVFEAETAFAINVESGDMHRLCSYGNGDGGYIVERITQGTNYLGPFFSGTSSVEHIKDSNWREWILAYVSPASTSFEWNLTPGEIPIIGDTVSLIKKTSSIIGVEVDYQEFWIKFSILLAKLGEVLPGEQTKHNFYKLYPLVDYKDTVSLLASPCDYTRKIATTILKNIELNEKRKKANEQNTTK